MLCNIARKKRSFVCKATVSHPAVCIVDHCCKHAVKHLISHADRSVVPRAKQTRKIY